MGIGDGMRVVIYDAHGMFSAARVWWTFRAMGNEDVAVLNGGLAKWISEGNPRRTVRQTGGVSGITPPAVTLN